MSGSLQLFAWRCAMTQVEIIENQAAFQELQGPGWVHALGAYPRTFARIMAAKHALFSPGNGISLLAPVVTRVSVVALRGGQGHGTQVVEVRGQSWTRTHAATTLDAIAELQISLQLLGRLKILAARIIYFGLIRSNDVGFDRAMLVQHGPKIRNQVADDSKIRQWRNAELCVSNLQNLCIAG
jgi:hypothetical protein